MLSKVSVIMDVVVYNLFLVLKDGKDGIKWMIVSVAR
jgi:hypothetical protein